VRGLNHPPPTRVEVKGIVELYLFPLRAVMVGYRVKFTHLAATDELVRQQSSAQ